MPRGRENLSGGRAANFCGEQSVVQLMNKAGLDGYDFIVTCVSHPRCCLDINELVEKAHEMSGDAGEMTPKSIIDEILPEMTIADTTLLSQHWSRLVVGRISPWIDPDSDNPYIRLLSEKSLTEELAYFAYLSVPAVLVPIRGKNSINLARIILNTFVKLKESSFAIWADVPITVPHVVVSDEDEKVQTGKCGSSGGIEPDCTLSPSDGPLANCTVENSDQTASTGTWQWFYQFRRSCNNHRRISLVLELTADLPESQWEIARWKGEPIVGIKLDTRTFHSNSTDGPVLSDAHRRLVKQFFRMNLQCIVNGPTLHVDKSSADQHSDQKCQYFEYLNHQYRHRGTLPSLLQSYASDHDQLYDPMCPLVDHLVSAAYRGFEEDRIKYDLYGKALNLAIERVRWLREDSIIDHTNPIVVMVLGAGRGGIVDVAYNVLKMKSPRVPRQLPFKLYAIEKNSSATVTLRSKNGKFWKGEVVVIQSDMRKFKSEDKADIVISELLGSFGDNELSPECLDGAVHLMKPHCISIPEWYRSFIAPIHSPFLFNQVRSVAENEWNPRVAYESPYVCHLFNYFEIAEPKELFRFDHPNFKGDSNDRFKELQFIAKETSEVMGLAGYFEATLFNDFTLSILPGQETPKLHSWYPFFLSFPEPVLVKKGETIEVRFWRVSTEHRVWYEWQLMKPKLGPICNADARSHHFSQF